jgi:glyceraldehyde 3-phosphate dehydrogenase
MSSAAKDHPFLSAEQGTQPLRLGINGAGRIGKLTVWHHVSRKSFQGLVINVGREVGMGLEDIAQYLARDSTYGPLERYLYGFKGGRVVDELNEREGTMTKEIPWKQNRVEIVVDCTGVFRDPTLPPDMPKGSLRGHLEAGSRKVILSAPFKVKDKSKPMPEDAVTAIQGINEEDYDSSVHSLISTASCTTTCLAFMVRPILDKLGSESVLSASMVTVHAATGSQEVLDRVPGAGTADLRKHRSLLNNIILTTTGAADALDLVIPEMRSIGFMAESVRVPINTGSLVILVLNIQDENPAAPIGRDYINRIYQEAAEGYLSKYLAYSESQNVSADIIGTAAAAIIEGRETHTRTALIRLNLSRIFAPADVPIQGLDGPALEIPVTQVVTYGWYDNELGCYAHMLGERTMSIARTLLS